MINLDIVDRLEQRVSQAVKVVTHLRRENEKLGEKVRRYKQWVETEKERSRNYSRKVLYLRKDNAVHRERARDIERRLETLLEKVDEMEEARMKEA